MLACELATFRRKSPSAITGNCQAAALGDHHLVWPVGTGAGRGQIGSGRLCGGLGSDKAADVDEVVSDDPQSDPALHAVVATITATLEPMPTLADADASLASGTPSLSVAEPTLLLLARAAGILGAMVGNADALHTFGFCRCLVLTGMEPSISCDQAWDASQ